MTDEQKFLFDLHGYLPPSQCPMVSRLELTLLITHYLLRKRKVTEKLSIYEPD